MYCMVIETIRSLKHHEGMFTVRCFEVTWTTQKKESSLQSRGLVASDRQERESDFEMPSRRMHMRVEKQGRGFQSQFDTERIIHLALMKIAHRDRAS